MPIPDFIDGYYLPPGEYKCSLEEIEKRFANGSPSRKQSWEYFMFYLNRLKHFGIKPKIILINGSFVTGKNNAGDVDCVMLINPEEVRQALKNMNEHDKNGLIILTDYRNADLIRAMLGVHIFVTYNNYWLQLWSNFFRKIKPSTTNNKNEISTPKEKGILRVEFR